MPECLITHLTARSMDTISRYLTTDHKRCDDALIEAENFVNENRWDHAETCLQQFCKSLEHNFAMEEEILFLAFEKAIGSSEGPTSVMRNEHQHIRGILTMLQNALKRHDSNAFLGHADTLNIMMQQHNLKEESILYPMADRILSDRTHDIIDAMAGVAT
jgi:hemerythrin-like domain-containing protein